MTLEQDDSAARADAMDTTRSFLLQAPAGSGKTTVLTCRLLALLATVAAPEEVLAITFTRKAAAQMRLRVLEALRSAADGTPGREPEAVPAAAALSRDEALGWGLLRTPARLRVMTIDAFCQTLAVQLPIASRSGLRLEVATPARPLYASAARRALHEALVDPSTVPAAQLLFARLDNDWQRLEELLILMLAQRAHWLPRVLGVEVSLERRVATSLERIIVGTLTAALARLPATLRQQGIDLARHAARTLASQDAQSVPTLGVAAEDLPQWRALCQLALTADGRWRQQWNKNNGFLPAHKLEKERVAQWVAALQEVPEANALFNEIMALPDARIAASDTEALAALSILLRLAAAELQLEFANQGRVDFAAVSGAARQALSEHGQPTDLALRCGNAIRHILIDEFQDTSLDQFELLRALTAGWESGDGRTLFAVGDPMQSIYQFREAEVGLFLRARDQGVGTVQLTSLRLRRNFRSAPQLIEWVNRHFSGIFPATDDARSAAICYSLALAARSDLNGLVAAHALMADAPPADAHEAEATQIVALIAARRAQDPHLSIAVLVNARHHAVPIVAALQAAGIAIRGVKLEALRERPVVRDLCALARALQHLADRTAWLALLHAPMCGLSLQQMQQLTEGDARCIWELLGDSTRLATQDQDAGQRLLRVRTALLPGMNGAERALALWQRVDRAWLRLGGPAAYRELRDLQDAQEFLLALAREPHAEQLAGDAFDEFAAELYAAPPAAPGAVEVLTMHGAKGLEWDVVIVPGIGRRQRPDSEPLLHWLELPAAGHAASSDLLMAPMSAVASGTERTLAKYIQRLRRQRARLERARVLYVAATRARRELHWFGQAPLNSAGELVPRADTALGLLWPAIAGEFQAQRLAALASENPPSPAQASAQTPPQTSVVASAHSSVHGWRLRADWRAPDLPAPVHVERLDLYLKDTSAEPEYLWVGLAARAVGSIVHAQLQRLSQLGTLPEAPAGSPEAYGAWLEELGVLPEERAAAGERIHAALSATLGDRYGRWLLGPEHREQYCEYRLTGLHGGRVVNVIVDRLLVEADGTRWIVDYKTSSHEGGDLEGFLTQEVRRYRPQLERYATLVRAALQGPGATPPVVRAALYFPLLGEFREVREIG